MTDPAPTPLQALAASLRERIAAGEPAVVYVDDLRLLILARIAQGRSDREVEAELAAWGLHRRYVKGLIRSARSEGQFGPTDAYIEAGEDAPMVRNVNPTYGAKVRAADRADRRYREARRLAEAELPPSETDPALATFHTVGHGLAATRQADRRQVIVAAAVVAAVAAAVVWVLC